jgi:hypothetical protein
VPDRSLSSSPSLLALLLRAGATAIPGLRRASVPGARAGDPFDTRLVLARRAEERDRLARYARVCGFGVSDTLPLTYPHVLAFGLQMTLLTEPAFPFPAAGLVHVANRIVRRRRIGAAEALELGVWLEPVRAHPRGSSVTIRTEAVADGETVWEEWSTMLRRGEYDADATAPPGPPPATGPATNAVWRPRGDLGRRYAAVSGDRNPIHLHALTAKAFGFPRPLAHGMWTLARCVAALGPELPEAVAVEVAFRRPLLLPATVSFSEAVIDGGAIAFGVRGAQDGAPHLDGLARQSGSASAS